MFIILFGCVCPVLLMLLPIDLFIICQYIQFSPIFPWCLCCCSMLLMPIVVNNQTEWPQASVWPFFFSFNAIFFHFFIFFVNDRPLQAWIASLYRPLTILCIKSYYHTFTFFSISRKKCNKAYMLHQSVIIKDDHDDCIPVKFNRTEISK